MIETLTDRRALLQAHLDKQDYHSLMEIWAENMDGIDPKLYPPSQLIWRIMQMPEERIEEICRGEGLK